MDLESVLRSIRALSDLPKLVAALEHQPLWEVVPSHTWVRKPGSPVEIMAVGQSAGLPWFAVQSRTPEPDVLRLARRLSRRGRLALVLALNPDARRLAVAVAFERCPRVELDLEQPERDALASIARLSARPEGGSLAFAALAADALSAESVGRRFFRQFRATLDQLAAGLPGPLPNRDRHDLALLQLTRVLFLYFIQTKGWLGARERFLSEAVDGCLARGRRIHRDLLRPLFFGTLNRPTPLRSRIATAFGPIPFLNGGLFEPHPLERRFRRDIPNALWRDAFEQLFERFHFTVSERGREGAVAPDMLGRVFEGVMAPEVRRSSGTFYTPTALVSLVLDAAFVALVAGRLPCGEAEAERRIGAADPSAMRVLASLTLLDPAVGSGAFLLGALERLAAGCEGRRAAARKRLVLQRNLFGVDQSAAAVRLTELRLWLAVVADDSAERPDTVSPLPNLDCLIRQGDSLFDPIGAQAGTSHTPELVSELADLRSKILPATGPEKRALLRRLRVVESRLQEESLNAAENHHRSQITDCLEQARAHDLFGQPRGLDRELRGRLRQLRRTVRRLRQARRSLGREAEVPWFHYHSHFADVFAGGGFDLVVGNPPWLRSEGMPPELRSRLAGRYRWWRTRGNRYGNGPDLAIAFLERGLELTRPGGVLAMLVPAKLLSASYAAIARHALAATTTLHSVTDLTGNPVAGFEATVYPLALIARKEIPPPGHLVRTTLQPGCGEQVHQTELAGGGPWILSFHDARAAMAALERDHPKLGERIISHLGLKTGLNRVFLNPPDSLEPELLRWAVRGRDLEPFRAEVRMRLLWTHDAQGQPLRSLPSRTAAYLELHRPELEQRTDCRKGPWWMLFRAQPAAAAYRVIWADLARRLVAVPLHTRSDRDRIPLNTCYVAPVSSALEAQTIAAWLNSTWIRALARLGAMPASGGFARFNAQVVSRLPLPGSVLTDRSFAELARAGREGAVLQTELDELATHHLGLSRSDQRALRASLGSAPGHRR